MADAAFLLELRGVRKSFGGVEVLQGVDFQLKRGEIHALLGQNGAGKSTLMKLIDGVHQRDGGEMLINSKLVNLRSPAEARSLGIGMVFQEFSLISSMTVEQNVVLTQEPARFGFIGRRAERERARQALAALGVDVPLGKLIGRLPVGDHQMVEIAETLLHDPRILILDEPTASLSREEVARLFIVLRGLREKGIGIIYISHHLHEVMELCDRVTVLKDGLVTMRASRDEVSVAALVEAVVGCALDAEVKRVKRPVRSGPPLIEVNGLQVGRRVKGASFAVHRGEVVGIAGLVGSGRSEILETLFGLRRFRGQVRWKGESVRPKSPAEAMRLGIALIPEDRRREGLVATHSVRDNMLLAAWPGVSRSGLISDRAADKIVTSFVDRLRIRVKNVLRPVATLSGGNQQKVVIAKFLAVRPQLLMFDEPTAGIDVGTKRQIINQIRGLAAEGYAAIFVSSDLQEIVDVADRVLILQRGVVTREIDCFDARPSEADLAAALQAQAA